MSCCDVLGQRCAADRSYFGTGLRRIGKRMTLDNDSRAPKEPSEYNVSSSLLGPQYDRAKSVPLSRALKATIFQARHTEAPNSPQRERR